MNGEQKTWTTVAVALALVLMTLITNLCYNSRFYYEQRFSRDKVAFTNGYCQEQNIGNGGYGSDDNGIHWVKCK